MISAPVVDLRRVGDMDDPTPYFRRLRDSAPVHRAGPGQWAVVRYEDVAALLRDSRLGSEFPPLVHKVKLGDGPAAEFFARILIDRDPPVHTVLRRRLGPAFSPPVVRRLSERIGQLVDDLLAPAVERGRIDAVAELGYVLPVTVVCELMGLPAEDRDMVRPRMIDLAVAFGALSLSDAQRKAADEAVVWLRDYIGPLLARRREGHDDQLSRLLTGDSAEPGPHQAADLLDNAVFLLFAGFETTMNLIANGCAALLRFPDQLDRLRADLALVPTAVEEFLRFDAPIQMSMRLVREPVEIGGHRLRRGRVVVLALGSANHDERVFDKPAKLDVARKHNPHLSFGGGHHYCLGATLARIEAAAVFERLLRVTSSIAPAGSPVRRREASIRAFASVPIALTPR